MKSPILVDVSLTGGRGPAKKAFEVITGLKNARIPFTTLTDREFLPKLKDLGIQPDFVVNTAKTEPPTKIISSFENQLKGIDFSILVKLGARVAGPYVAQRMNKPYILVDGGLPDKVSNTNLLYDRTTFQKALKVLITTQFPWDPPKRTGLTNIQVCNYPLSENTQKIINTLRDQPKEKIVPTLINSINGDTSQIKKDLLITIVMTGDYLGNPRERVTYGGWLTSRQYDQCIGFIRRLLIDLGEVPNRKFSIFMDTELVRICSDVLRTYPNINPLTFKKWDYYTEIATKAAADVTISRATNYQPYIASLYKGCNVTTPVPANGYMDEDTAAKQYERQGLTKLIQYDDEAYVEKLLEFIESKNEQSKIIENLKKNQSFLERNNLIRVIKETYFKYI